MNSINYSLLSQVETVKKLTKLDFLQKYARPSKPVIITDIISNWKAKERWTSVFFKKNFSDIQVDVFRTTPFFETKVLRLGDYLDYIESTKDINPFYLRDWYFHDDCPELLNDYDVPKYFDSWLKQLPREFRLKLSWLFIGPANTGSPLHIDTMMTSAWNGVISGKKRWLLYPPNQAKYLYFGQVDAFNPDLVKYPLFSQAQPLFCVQSPGEILFIPSGWWHQVINEESGISITENFVNESNYKVFSKFIKNIEDLNPMIAVIEQYVPQLRGLLN